MLTTLYQKCCSVCCFSWTDSCALGFVEALLRLYCKIGYNDFNYLVMQTLTLWWLHNYQKKIFRFFEPFPAHSQSKCSKSGNKSKKKFVNQNSIWVSKISRWFPIRWKSFEKMHQKKVINKSVTEICTFLTFTHVCQTCDA